MLDIRTMKRITEQFQTEYTLAEEPWLGKPHTLSDNDRTKIREHTDENSGMAAHCVAQELGHKCEMVHSTLRKGISPIEFLCCTN